MKTLQPGGAVDAGRVDEILRNLGEELAEEKDDDAVRQTGHDETLPGIQPAQLPDENE